MFPVRSKEEYRKEQDGEDEKHDEPNETLRLAGVKGLRRDGFGGSEENWRCRFSGCACEGE